jgi:steroid 5-alpha reductase family enzyme
MQTSFRSVIVIGVAVLLGAGIAWAGSAGSTAAGPLSLFAVAVVAAFLIQWIIFVPSWLARTERFYDLTGGISYLAITVFLLLANPGRGAAAWVLGVMLVLWSVRLALFLFTRVLRAGGDGRFDDIKQRPVRLLQTWTLQGLWITATAGTAWSVLSDPSGRGIDAWLVIGAMIWVVGLGVEAAADAQKRAFAAREENQGRYITRGLWAISRHPNYLGEIVLWIGVAIAAVPSLHGAAWVLLVSPVFVTLLLTKVSGVPLLERRAEARWGSDPAYRAYVDATPILVPAVGRKGAWAAGEEAAA